MASYSNDQLKEIGELAAVFFTPKEIALILEFPVEEFMLDCLDIKTPPGQAFHAGKLKSEFELRKSVLSLAKSGSSPAQSMALDLVKSANMKMIDRE